MDCVSSVINGPKWCLRVQLIMKTSLTPWILYTLKAPIWYLKWFISKQSDTQHIKENSTQLTLWFHFPENYKNYNLSGNMINCLALNRNSFILSIWSYTIKCLCTALCIRIRSSHSLVDRVSDMYFEKIICPFHVYVRAYTIKVSDCFWSRQWRTNNDLR